MTPLLALTNTIVSIGTGFLLLATVLAPGLDKRAMDFAYELAVLVVLLILCISVISGWKVALGNSNKTTNSVWRISQTVTFFAVLFAIYLMLKPTLDSYFG